MIKNYSLILIAFLCFVGMGFGQTQIYTLNFETSGGYTTSIPEFTNGSDDYFIRTDGSNTTSPDFTNIQGNFYFAAQDIDAAGASLPVTLSINNINILGYTSLEFRIHLAEDDDGTNQDWDVGDYLHITGNIDGGSDIDLIWVENDGTTFNSAPSIDTDYDGLGDGTEITDVFSQFSKNITGTGSTLDINFEFSLDSADEDIAIDNIEIWGVSTSTDTPDWYNLQHPQNGSTNQCAEYLVYAQVYEDGVTNAAGADSSIEAWIGYNTSDTDPSDASWTWIPASYNVQVGNYDEYFLDLGAELTTTGTYYYASRFRYNSGPFVYGGYNSGEWDGTTNVNGVVTVSNEQVNFCNVDYPKTATINEGDTFTVYAQVYEPGITDAVGQGANISAWIGYNTTGINHQPWDASGWTWVPATYNPSCLDCNGIQNDEYYAEIGSGLSGGTYYFASRFQINCNDYSYGGIQSDNVGNFWDATNNNGVLNVISTSTDCGSESFNNSNATSSYSSNSFVGDNGVNWTYVESRDENGDANGSGIDGNAIMLRQLSDGSKITSSSVSGGIADFSVKLYKGFTGTGDRQVELFVNGISQGTSTPFDDFSEHIFTVNGINIFGNVIIEIRNITSKQVIVDDIQWTCYNCATPSEATNFLATNGCGGISLNWDLGCSEEVMLVASQGSAVTAVPTGDGSAYTANTIFGSGTDLGGNEYDVYEGTGTSTTVTGLTNGATYYFTLFSRVGSSWSAGVTSSATYNVNVLNPATFSSYNRCGDILLTWTLPACHDEVLIIAKDTNPVTQAPSGDGSSYTASTIFGSGTEIGGIATNEYIVYKGAGDQVTVTGLTNGNTYNFKIFTRVGTNWSSGATNTGLSDTGSGPSPTIFKPGDLVFVGFDSYIYGSTDKYSILNLVDIGPDTEFIMANLLYEWNDLAGTSSGKWYTCAEDFIFDPEYALIKYTGCANIPKGSIICIETVGGSDAITSISVNGVSADTEFYIDPAHTRAGNISTSSADAIWFMQGSFSPVMTESDGPDGDSLDDRYRTFSGTVLGALQTKGDFKDIGDNGYGFINGTTPDRISRIHPDVECLAIETGAASINATKFFAFYDGLTFNISNPPTYSLTQYEALALITDFGTHWQIQSSDDASVQDDDNIDFTCNTSFNISNSTVSEGQWIGSVSTDWFDCHNWQNFTVPDATVDVTINSTSNGNCVIDPSSSTFAAKYNDIAESNNLTLDSNSYSLNMPDTSSLLHLYGNWTSNYGEAYFNEGNGTVTFKGFTHQRINYGGPPTPPAFQTEEFYNVILDNDFDTFESNDLHANGDLTINLGKRLDVRSGDYVFADQTVTNNGTFYIADSASLVQSGNGTNTNIGNIIMDRTANNLQLLDYVYWSSPVNQFNTNSIFSTSSYIYKWETTAPNGNGGEGTWISAVGEPMSIGRGYITRVPNSLSGTSLTATFTGTSVTGKPNNGNISVPVYRGDNIGVGNSSGDPNAIAISIYDDNWNLLGNPYPSAISAKDFLTVNTNIDGFVCLWRHITQPTSDIDPFYDDFGNGTNYTDSDYVYFNLTGVSTPPGFDNYNVDSSDKYIAAGQSFLVNMLESTGSNPSVGSASETVVFNNSMRDIFNDNSQFYRTDSSIGSDRNRIWLNLYNSNFTAINTILLGYVEGATMERDRLYDAVTNSVNTKIYSLINDEKFIIQGRSLPFEVTDHIPLGLAASNSGSYYIGLSAVDGLFENDNQNIFVKDNYLNIIFDITQSPYSFSTEAGEFNDRFEIVFQTTVLSTEDTILSANDLTIIELPDGSVKFKVGKNHTISQVEIIDLLGRTLYTLKCTGSEAIYFLPQLSQSAYIAKVTLNNGQTLSKKAIKKN